jgi:glutaredoxin-like protein NrdH
MKYVHQDGKNIAKVVLFALSTCIWCKKTKQLLKDLNIAYDYVDVDLEPREVRHQIKEQLLKWSDNISYPFMIINEERIIKGYEEEEIKAIAQDGE